MKGLIALFLLVVMTACSKPNVQSYIDREPILDLVSYFNGKTTGWGMVQDRKGEVIRQFVVSIDGTISDDGSLVLHEEFVWSDGEESVRIWTIKETGDSHYTGTAGDVVGTAVGRSAGNALNWNYYLDIEAYGSTWKVHLDDWMYLNRDRVLINKVKMSKFGFHLGDITITFSKQQGEDLQ